MAKHSGIAIVVIALLLGASVARAEIKVLRDSDLVKMRDGTEVKGTVVFVGARSVIVVTDEGEQTLEREKIERIQRALDASKPSGYALHEQDGHLLIVPGGGDDAVEGGAAAVEPEKAVRPWDPDAPKLVTPHQPPERDQRAMDREKARELLDKARNLERGERGNRRRPGAAREGRPDRGELFDEIRKKFEKLDDEE